jgi:ammonia channel protein AmtB
MATFAPDAEDLGYAVDLGWIMTAAGFVFAAQIGLGLMEIGSIRRKNSRIVWYKILINIVLTIWWWYILGFAWAFGDSFGVFLGAERFYAGDKWDTSLSYSYGNLPIPINHYQYQFAHYVWRVATATVATTIATAILSERITLKGVVFFNFFFNMITLPFVYAWTFGRGFLVDDIGYRDFAGTFSVFGVGAFAGLVGLLLIKPRYNRYGRWPVVVPHDPRLAAGVEFRPQSSDAGSRNLPSVAFDKLRKEPIATGAPISESSSSAFSAENIVRARKRVDEDANEGWGVTNFGTVLLGAIILFIALIFFNAGATNSLVFMHLIRTQIAQAGTVLAAMGGGLITLILLAIFGRRRPIKDNAATFARAVIAGIVAVSAGVHDYFPWASLVVGILGAVSYLIMAWIIHHAEFDDPTEFFALFGGAALGGIFSAAFFNRTNGIWYDNATEGEIVIYQMLGTAILVLWTAFVCFIGFWLLKVTRTLRVSLKTEIVGYDYIDAARHLDYDEKLQIVNLEKRK